MIIGITGWIKQNTRVPGWSHIGEMGEFTNTDDNIFLAVDSFTGGNNEKFSLVII